MTTQDYIIWINKRIDRHYDSIRGTNADCPEGDFEDIAMLNGIKKVLMEVK
ncbi:hypothetical protein [Streptococcus hyovaginalis]|uniref:hypothetical protein n=1 Tax=Streptococcus hyovaginalis TaxID=149015 RepID=UPI002A7FB02B|nr:hypothetical protein [Streptococcus hyovaginalis]MDY4510751.1 hypothetical protein [Streptococcus hyovaginalis]